ncbi:MAG: hypothetical protein ACD_59C00013G0004 [uncultured bacterium]|nr:MAG: hypothetical protein ACD_59C00013G0004 [uncultured bacterium]
MKSSKSEIEKLKFDLTQFGYRKNTTIADITSILKGIYILQK